MTGTKNTFSTQAFNTHIYICQNIYTFVCLKISIASLYYIEHAFDKCHQQLTINQLIFDLSIMPVFDLRIIYHWAELSHNGAELSLGPSCLGFTCTINIYTLLYFFTTTNY